MTSPTSQLARIGCGVTLFCAASSLPGAVVLAEGEYEGMWETGPTRVSVSVQSWGEDCGTRPRSAIRPAGGAVRITQSGHHLIIHSRGRALRSDGCWSPNPALRRASSSFLDGVWNTLCHTPPDDPKSETGEYTLRLEGNDKLQYKDVSRYNWELKESTCVATIITTQTLTRVRGEAAKSEKTPTPPPEVAVEEPDEEAKAPEPEKSDRTCQPGAPARLVLQPKRAEIEPGQRVCFRARVVDGSGCTVPGQAIEWSLGHAPGLRGALQDGCFRAASSAAEAEGQFRVVASSAGLRSQALISVKPIDLSDLIAKRIEGGAVSGFAEKERSEPEPEKKKEQEESATLGVEVQKSGASNALLVAFAAVSALGIAAVLFAIRLRRRSRSSGLEQGAFEDEAEALAKAEAPAAPGSTPPSATTATNEQWICPVCRRGYSREKGVCPRDGTALVPYEQFIEQHKARQDSSKKMRCPKCGEIFPATVAFCGKDGTPLEPMP